MLAVLEAMISGVGSTRSKKGETLRSEGSLTLV